MATRPSTGAGEILDVQLRPYLRVARLPFLALPVTLVVLGVTAAARDGSIVPVRSLLALIGLLAAHVAVNALNEASDYERGIDQRTDPTPFSGGSGALPDGELQPGDARRFAYLAAGVAAGVGVYFLATVGPAVVPLLVAGAVFAIGYTDVFARVALGEVVAGLGLGGLPVLGVALVQDGAVGPTAVAVTVPASLLTAALLLLNEFPDEHADRTGGRRNVVLVFGRRRAAWTYVLVALAVPASLLGLVALGRLPTWALLGVVPSLLLARPLSWALYRPEQSVPVERLRDNVAWILGTNLAVAIGIAAAGM
ncbi:prenyltransferase [Halapricum hydrolyticum]|uniref:Prenyltransferase n=1 Tax=Halapricum hydrolyticum TaxID=2979991 RepID=A0AAE3IDG6_9EURY|nr:prenyltransferase [Halapricum hydrolyticum]MCU4719542.1 prenyltransferase [Halapricum hydrolyticum]MCU4728515.1 prenyltransferase [Halapricum hydrolyticum]